MMNKRAVLLTILPAFWLAFSAGPLWAENVPDKTASTHIGDDRDDGDNGDHLAVGCPISVTKPVTGDLVAAGCDVEVLAAVSGNLVLMGGNLRLAAPVKQGVYAAAGRISIESDVGGNVRSGAGKLSIGPNAKVAGNVDAGSGEVEIDGAIGGNLRAGAGRVRINGPIAGNADIESGEVELGPNARIDGKLTYKGGSEIRRDPAAQVRGDIEQTLETPRWKRSQSYPSRSHLHHGWGWSLMLMLLAGFLVAALPQFYTRVSDTTRTRWPEAVLIGFVTLVCAPVVAVIAILTLIGIPLAIALIVGYLGLIVWGHATAGVIVGDVMLKRWGGERSAVQGWRAGAAVAGVLILAVLASLPWIGGFISLIAIVTGMGALLLQTHFARPAAGV